MRWRNHALRRTRIATDLDSTRHRHDRRLPHRRPRGAQVDLCRTRKVLRSRSIHVLVRIASNLHFRTGRILNRLADSPLPRASLWRITAAVARNGIAETLISSESSTQQSAISFQLENGYGDLGF